MSDISIIIPVHNSESVIERTLRSCTYQSLSKTKYDIIVVDDGSIDATSSIIRNFNEEICIISNSKPIGAQKSFIHGVRQAKTRYIVRVDSDDYLHPDFLLLLHSYLEFNADMQAVAADYIVVDDKEQHLHREIFSESPIDQGIMYRKDKLIELGLYNNNSDINENKDLRSRFEQNWEIYRVPIPLYRHMPKE